MPSTSSLRELEKSSSQLCFPFIFLISPIIFSLIKYHHILPSSKLIVRKMIPNCTRLISITGGRAVQGWYQQWGAVHGLYQQRGGGCTGLISTTGVGEGAVHDWYQQRGWGDVHGWYQLRGWGLYTVGTNHGGGLHRVDIYNGGGGGSCTRLISTTAGGGGDCTRLISTTGGMYTVDINHGGGLHMVDINNGGGGGAVHGWYQPRGGGGCTRLISTTGVGAVHGWYQQRGWELYTVDINHRGGGYKSWRMLTMGMVWILQNWLTSIVNGSFQVVWLTIT